MAKSLKDSMKELEEMNNAKIMSDDITAYSLEAASFSSPVVDNETTVSTYTNTTLPYSEKYLIYNEYVDEKISTIDENKNIELDESQVNLTQEENSQYVRFKMFRRYDGVDQLNMTLLMHAVTPDKNDVYISPVNVQYDDNYLYFGVILPKSVCAVKGTVQFEIQAVGVNEKGDAYTLKTRKAEFNVEESLSGNGTVEPGEDTGWITTFLQQVTEKVGEAQTAANEAKASANSAESSATTAQKTVNTAKTELTNTVNSTIKTALTNYYNKKEIDDQFANIDLSDVYDKINSIDGLAKFNVTYIPDTHTLSFYNGDKKIKDVVLNSDPSATWVTAYGKVVDKKITDAITPVSKSLNDYKTKTDADLSAIHKNIDNLPDTLKTKYYDKEAMNDLLGKKASNSDVESLTTKVWAVEQVTNSNKTSISTMGNKIASLEDAIGKIDVEPGKTYEATYDTESGNYTLWEITNEGETNEERTIKSQFKIVGGSGGGSTSTTLKIEYVTKSPVIVTTNDKAIIKYNFSGQDSSGDIVSEGNYTWKIGNKVIATGIAISGENSFDCTDYISLGSQKLVLTISDDAGSVVVKSWTVQKVDIHIESTFNDTLKYPMGEVSFDYTPYGAISKDIHFKIDGNELYKVTTTATGIPMAYNIKPQTHGAHLVEVYITAEINGLTVESNHIYKDVIWFNPDSNAPVIGCIANNLTVKQYDTENITYTVYDPKTENPTVTLAVDGKEVSTLQLDSNTNVWQYKPTDVGSHVLTITCGDTVKTINVTVEKLDIDVEPVIAGLQFDFNPVGRSNNDANRLWSDENNSSIKMAVSDNFDWDNGGYQIDENGDQYFGIKAGTTATISYNLFADDARKNGKEFKLIFKTSNVAKSDATFLSCESDGIGLQMNVHEAYIKSNVKSLYIPYSEEDIIEWEFNINKDSDIPIVMSYEDGTPCRPMSYTSDYSFTQETPAFITIGCDDCDVAIYRMKAYNVSLTSKAILSNFVADARTATEMISRYKRNQIYDENGMLTPEHLAAVLVYGASRIQSMGDVSTCYIHDNDFSKATRLKKLIIGNETEGYSNNFLTNLVIGNNKLLELLDVRNTPNLVTSLDLSKCGSLKKLYASGSGLTGITFANGGKIDTAILPETLTSIIMRNLKYLTNLQIPAYDKFTSMVIEYCNTVDSASMIEKATKLNRIRLLGIKWNLDTADLLAKLYKLGGIDKNGYNADQSVVTGSVHTPVMKEKLLAQYNETWSDLDITYNTLIQQFTVTFVNDNGDVLDTQYVDKGEKPINPITRADNPIPVPTKESTISTDFTFNGWDANFVAVFGNQTYKATYSEKVRQYTVKYMSMSTVIETHTADYDSYVAPPEEIPTYTAEESAYKYYLFKGWDKSGRVDGDKEIHAVYDVFEYTQDYFKDKELSELKPVEIYALTKLGLQSSMITLKDQIVLSLGSDCKYTDIKQNELISEKTVFSGTNYIDTGIKLFDKDRSFVFAIDYRLDNKSASPSVLAQCFKSDGSSGFKLWTNSGAKLAWGTSSTNVAIGTRNIIVIRHIKGETGLHVYNGNLTANAPSYVELSRNRETVVDSTLVFGCSKADDGMYENYAIGEIYWAKVWFSDLGEKTCMELASWTHDTLSASMYGFNRYYLSDGSGKRTSMSFIADNVLSQTRMLGAGSSNSGGYANMTIRSWLNTRLYNALSVEWKQLIKLAKIASSVGNQLTEVTTSDNYFYLPSVYELSPEGDMEQEPYTNEGTHIEFFTNASSRIRKSSDGKAQSYWTRSPNASYNGYFFRVEENGALSGYDYPYTAYGIVVEFSF